MTTSPQYVQPMMPGQTVQRDMYGNVITTTSYTTTGYPGYY